MAERDPKKSYCFSIDVKIYPVQIYISVGESDEEFFETIMEIVAPEYRNRVLRSGIMTIMEDGDTRGFVYQNQNIGFFMARFKKAPETAKDHCTIAHEIFHLTADIMDYVGMKLSGDSSEAYAYLLDYITWGFYEFVLNKANEP